MKVNAYMLVHNNLLTKTWLEHFIGRLMNANEKWKKTLQTSLLWTYGLGCIRFWQIAPNIISHVVTFWICVH